MLLSTKNFSELSLTRPRLTSRALILAFVAFSCIYSGQFASLGSSGGDVALADGPAATSCGFVREAILDASAIRGLKILRPVPCKPQNQTEVQRFLVDSIEKKIPEARIRGEELTFKLLGFIPLGYDYLHGLIEL